MCNALGMQNEPDLIGAREACRILDVNRSTLTRWVEAGRLTPKVRLPGDNGAHLFDRGDVERLHAERQTEPARAG